MELLEQRLNEQLGFDNIVGSCAAMREVFDQVERAARVDSIVLVRGESGTGKELVAEAVHRNSRRRNGPFLAVNMAAVPETLLESELFGHVGGAFTGASKKRIGRFEAAHGGTLFIDEIGDLPISSQVKLLRVLENHRITPVGSNDGKEVDVRVIFATNRNLEKMVAEGQFREDLYYRVNVITISLPPLRSRRDDIALLTQHLLDEVCAANGKPSMVPEEKLMRFLELQYWPGNVRQLRNCLESMVVLARSDVLSIDDVPAHVRAPRRISHVMCRACQDLSLEEIVKSVVLERLDRCGGNRTLAAQSLGISVRTLQRKLRVWQNGGDPDAVACSTPNASFVAAVHWRSPIPS